MSWLQFVLKVAPEAFKLAREAWAQSGRDGDTAKLVVTSLRQQITLDRAQRDRQAREKFGTKP